MIERAYPDLQSNSVRRAAQRRAGLAAVILMLAPAAVAAGAGRPGPAPPQSNGPVQAGRVASSSVGPVGQRQTGSQSVAAMNPTGRIVGRIESRVRSRLRTRIDRTYVPEADAASPYTTAQDGVQAAGRARR